MFTSLPSIARFMQDKILFAFAATAQFSIISKDGDFALDPNLKVINKQVKKQGSQYRSLRYSTHDFSPTRNSSIYDNPVSF
ncbi:hypothetical protein FKM82_010772 [Ascaphus truei]